MKAFVDSLLTFLSHPPDWLSNNILAILSLVATILSFVILLWLQTRGRKLVWEDVSITTVPDVLTAQGGTAPRDLKLLHLKVWNAGREPIKADDFDPPFTLDFGKATILSFEKVGQDIADVGKAWHLSSAGLVLGRISLNPKVKTEVSVLLSNYAEKDEPQVTGQIVKGSIQRWKGHSTIRDLIFVFGVLWLAVSLSFLFQLPALVAASGITGMVFLLMAFRASPPELRRRVSNKGRIGLAGLVIVLLAPVIWWAVLAFQAPAPSSRRAASTPTAARQPISEFTIPRADAQPVGIATAPDGTIWFTEKGNRVGWITSDGKIITEYPLPADQNGPGLMTTGADGILWFTVGNEIAQVTPGGSIKVFAPPRKVSFTCGITTGPDGDIWFTDCGGSAGSPTNSIWRLNPTSGAMQSFSIPTQNSNPHTITSGPDGALWFTEYSKSRIGRITTSGVVTEYPLPATSKPEGIVKGPDGALWFTEVDNKIGRITTSGKVQEFSLGASDQILNDITAGPDGAVWFSEFEDHDNTIQGSSIGCITTNGVVHQFPLPKPESYPQALTAGLGGTLWFTEEDTNQIGRIDASKNPVLC